MNNFTKTLNIINEASGAWRKDLSSKNASSWGLYDKKTSEKAAKNMSKELTKLIANGFKSLANGNTTIEQAAKDVYSSFSKFKKQYYKEGAGDTVVDDIAARIIADAFNVKPEIL